MLVSLNGPMGVGKTTFTEKLKNNEYEIGGELRVFPKSVKWYYNDQKYFAFLVHNQFIIERILLEIEITKNNILNNVVYDKHIADLYVYAEYSFAKGYLSEDELSSLYLLYFKYVKDLIAIDKILVLNSSSEILRENLIKRGREHEMNEEMLVFCLDFAEKYFGNFNLVAKKLELKNVDYITLESNDIELNYQRIKKNIIGGN